MLDRRRSRDSIVLACLLLLLAVVAPSVAGATWGQPGHSASWLYSNPVDGPLSPANIDQAGQRWSWTPGESAEGEREVGPVVVSGGRVFGQSETFDEGSYELFARSAQTGQLLWSAPVNRLTSHPVVYGARVWHADGGRLLTYSANCQDPCPPRVFTTRAGIEQPVLTADTVLAVADDGSRRHLLAYDRSCLSACAPRWRYVTESRLSPPSVKDGIAWVGTSGGRLLGFALNCASGGAACQPVRRALLAGKNFSTRAPALASRAYAIGTAPGSIGSVGTLVAFRTDCTTDCPPVWRSTGDRYSTPAVSGGRVWAVGYANDFSGTLDAYSTVCTPVGGRCRPQVSLESTSGPARGQFSREAPTVADGLVFAGLVESSGGEGDGGVEVFPAACANGVDCPPLDRFGGRIALASVAVSEGTFYLVERNQIRGGEDPGPFLYFLRAFSLP